MVSSFAAGTNRDQCFKAGDLDSLLSCLYSPLTDNQGRIELCKKILRTFKNAAAGASSHGNDSERALVDKLTSIIARTILEYTASANRALQKALKDLQSSFLTDLSAYLSSSESVLLESFILHFLRVLYDSQGKCVSKAVFLMIESIVREEKGRPQLSAESLMDLYASLGKGSDSPSLFEDILSQLHHKSNASSASKAFVALVGRLNSQATIPKPSLDIWCNPLEVFIAGTDGRQLADLYILPSLFKTTGEKCYYTVIERWGVRRDPDITHLEFCDQTELQLSCLKVGKELGYIIEERGDDRECVVLRAEAIRSLLVHAEPNMMLSALAVLVASGASTTKIASSVYNTVKDALHDLHEICDGDLRNQFMKIMKDVFQRVLSSSYIANRSRSRLVAFLGSDKTKYTKEDEEAIARHSTTMDAAYEFTSYYVDFLTSLLQPGSPHSSCVTAIDMIMLLCSAGLDREIFDPAESKRVVSTRRVVPDILNGNTVQWPFQISLATATIRQLLLENLFNPYEDIRKKVFHFLQVARPFSRLEYSEILQILERDLNRVSQSGRESDVDGFSKLVVIFCIYSGEKKLALPLSSQMPLPDCNSTHGISTWLLNLLKQEISSLHPGARDLRRSRNLILGTLSALAMVLEEQNLSNVHTYARENWHDLLSDAFKNCKDIWESSQESLRDSSPEGYIPSADTQIDSSQDLQSFCWRSVSACGRLFECLSLALISTAEDDSIDMVQETASILFDGLSKIRHKGAFTAVAERFGAVCTICLRSPEARLQEMPQSFLQLAFAQLKERSGVITRRSAGLPLIFTGILNAEIATKRQCSLPAIYQHLSGVSLEPCSIKNSEQLPQVHAINCLRSIYQESTLFNISEQFVVSGLQLSLNCFLSSIWAIRNSGIMLFNALINRIFGTQRARNDTTSSLSTTSFFERYPVLDVLRQITERGHLEESIDKVILPIFSLFARLRFSADGIKNMLVFQNSFIKYMGHQSWKIRESASRALTAIFGPDHLEAVVYSLLGGTITDLNSLHAKLYTARLMLTRDFCRTMKEKGMENVLGLKSAVVAHLSRKMPFNSIDLYLELICAVLTMEIDNSEQWSGRTPDENGLIREHAEHDSAAVTTFLHDVLRRYPEHWSEAHAPQILKQTLRTLHLVQGTGSRTVMVAVESLLETALRLENSMTVRVILESMLQVERSQTIQNDSTSLRLWDIMKKSTDVHNQFLAADVLSRTNETGPKMHDNAWDDFHIIYKSTTSCSLKDRVIVLLAEVATRCVATNDEKRPYIESATWNLIEAHCSADEVDTRLCGLQAMAEYSEGVRTLKYDGKLRCQFYTTLVDLLLDDSNDVRSTAIGTFRTISARFPKTSRSSIAGITEILKQETDPSAISWIVNWCVRKLTENALPTLLAEEQKNAQTLFLKEKQNTFIDEIFKSDMILETLEGHLSAIPRAEILSLKDWIDNTADSLLQKLSRSGELCQIWMSDPRIYQTGILLFSCSAILQSWMKVHDSDSEVIEMLGRVLSKVKAVTAERNIHPLWLNRGNQLVPSC